jgi:hypothetical protein
VRGTNVGSSQHRPAAVIPERGQVTDDSPESPSNERWAVFHERESWSNLANDAGHFSPQSTALAVDACALSGDADVLAGKPARNNVNTSAPRSAVKGANVIPNRERREHSVILSGEQNARGVGVVFNGAHCLPSEQQAAEYSATSACE